MMDNRLSFLCNVKIDDACKTSRLYINLFNNLRTRHYVALINQTAMCMERNKRTLLSIPFVIRLKCDFFCLTKSTRFYVATDVLFVNNFLRK